MYFGKKREQTDPRVPPNQNVTTSFPVLHHGNVPYYRDLTAWNLKVFGLVKEEKTFSYKEILELKQTDLHNDIHCVTGWSKLDNVWTGVTVKDLMKNMTILEEAKYVLLHAEEGWKTNLPIEDFLKESSMLAHSHNAEPLTPDHGFPLRAVIPHLYFWKSAKWLRGIEFVRDNEPGFWEKNGYHIYGDPWKEERFSWD
ncbi:sulfite oxidase-like oxidoreductase [Cytobacillus spongiae]|uniref:sulfite oxidase-like oxidoreductase n=1 Tax=Cytobacillus spongiae TaxID=2901381 RepID=UPI001F47B3CE|nr:sulfite oxidase-like oxidoreductase [Cytobacillus spongiae]UII55388.1 sulfite oxidase-like oxidoreductase [Cytobacillus spongiae]